MLTKPSKMYFPLIFVMQNNAQQHMKAYMLSHLGSIFKFVSTFSCSHSKSAILRKSRWEAARQNINTGQKIALEMTN